MRTIVALMNGLDFHFHDVNLNFPSLSVFGIVYTSSQFLSLLGSSMETNLKHIAQRRTDIFGAGDVETFIGQKIGEEDVKQPEKVTWDGHTASISATAQKAAAGISLEEQIEQIHKQIGMV